MKVLVLYRKLKHQKDRNTIDEHLYSFRRYVDNVQFHYFNAASGIPRYLTYAKYDGVILHYTFLVVRWDRDFFERWIRYIKRLRRIRGYKVAIPQDEYAETDILCELFRQYDVKTVFTCFSEEDYTRVYPAGKVPLEHLVTVFPGYVDEISTEKIKAFCPEAKERPIALGYRARKLPYWLGRHGQLKREIGQLFLERTRGTELRVDISTDEQDAFRGDEWYKFLCRSRAVLGCEGGASLIDPTGEIRKNVEQYVREKPEASFEDVERNCFPGQDYNIRLSTLSPRHFESAITRTCQVLLEGDYCGIFLPNVHYIELKRDYSNIDQVIELLKDIEYCAEVAENAYREIVLSGKYTYRVFANQVLTHIAKNRKEKNIETKWDYRYFRLLGMYLALRERLEPLLIRLLRPLLALKVYKMGLVKEAFYRIQAQRN